jgi:hypothetical protein
MRLLVLLAFAGVALAGCMSTEEMRAEQDAHDNAACIAYGAKPGTDGYVKCRTDLDRNRAIASSAPPVVVAGPGPYWGPGYGYGYGFGVGGFCRATVFGPRCY